MKLLTLNFTVCPIKACKSQAAAFPLQIRDAELEIVEQDFQPLFLRNIIPRIEWPAMQAIANMIGLNVPEQFLKEAASKDEDEQMDIEGEAAQAQAEAEETMDDESLKKLHRLILETEITNGKLVCPNCSEEYGIRDGIANFLLPPHLV